MSYQQAMAFLDETKKYGSRLGLVTIRRLMGLLGDVQEKVPIIHIAGTNGKGSVGAMLAAIFTAAGYRTGHFSSPDVFCYEEEFRIGGVPIGKDRLSEILTEVRAACKVMTARGWDHPTRFEVETAAAFLWFYEEGCDAAVIEAGMGGETDATNLIKRPALSILTAVSLDHAGFLGETVEEIAGVKAGIIKKDCPAVILGQEKSVEEVFLARCQKMRSPFILADEMAVCEIRTADTETGAPGLSFFWNSKQNSPSAWVEDFGDPGGNRLISLGEKFWDSPKKGLIAGDEKCGNPGEERVIARDRKIEGPNEGEEESFCFKTVAAGSPAAAAKRQENAEWKKIFLNLGGTYQAGNALCVLESLKFLRDKFPNLTENAVLAGLEDVKWPGRFEKIASDPDFYIDGAHNEGAVNALRNTVDLYLPGRCILYIMGVLADKDYETMIRRMFVPGDRVFTVTPENPRALGAEQLAAILRNSGVDAVPCKSAAEAVKRARQEALDLDSPDKITGAKKGVQGRSGEAGGTVILAFGSLSYLKDIKASVR